MVTGRRALHRTLVFGTALACVASGSGVFAQPVDDTGADGAPAEVVAVKDRKVARTWLQAGDTLVKKADQLAKQGKADEAKTSYVNAITAYTKAIEASDDPAPIQLLLAAAHDKAGDPASALKVLNAIVGTQGVRADVAKKAQARLDALSMQVGIVTLTVIPDGTAISLDGAPVGEAPLTEALVLSPGDHLVSFAAVGYQPRDMELEIEAGSESERKIELEPVPIVIRPEAIVNESTEPEAPVQPAEPSLLPMYIGGGAAVTLLLVGTVTGIAAVGKQNQFDDSSSPSERADLRSSGKSLALVTDLCLVGAVGAAAFTTYWYMAKYRPVAKVMAERQATRHTKQHPMAKVDVLPWVQPDTGGVLAVGSF